MSFEPSSRQLATQHRLEAREILTPEQQTQLQSCLSDSGNFGPGYGKRGGRPRHGNGPRRLPEMVS